MVGYKRFRLSVPFVRQTYSFRLAKLHPLLFFPRNRVRKKYASMIRSYPSLLQRCIVHRHRTFTQQFRVKDFVPETRRPEQENPRICVKEGFFFEAGSLVLFSCLCFSDEARRSTSISVDSGTCIGLREYNCYGQRINFKLRYVL